MTDSFTAKLYNYSDNKFITEKRYKFNDIIHQKTLKNICGFIYEHIKAEYTEVKRIVPQILLFDWHLGFDTPIIKHFNKYFIWRWDCNNGIPEKKLGEWKFPTKMDFFVFTEDYKINQKGIYSLHGQCYVPISHPITIYKSILGENNCQYFDYSKYKIISYGLNDVVDIKSIPFDGMNIVLFPEYRYQIIKIDEQTCQLL